MGVWIETPKFRKKLPYIWSHPVWVCGLKLICLLLLLDVLRHTLYGCVD